MKILLVDNEPDVRQTLMELINKMNPSAHQIEEASGVKMGLIKLESFKPEVVFLDVEMDDGTGFDLLRQVSAPTFQLIFTTAYNQYAIQAIKFSAIDYLMKPVDPIELATSLSKAAQNIANQNMQRQLEVLMVQLGHVKQTERQIVLKDMEATYFVKVSDILYCMAEGAYTQFFQKTNDPILVSRNLHTHEELLAPFGFLRCHHSCLVNPIHIKMFDRKTDSLVLDGGHSVPVSQRKKEEIIKMLESR